MEKPCGVIVAPRSQDASPEVSELRREVATLESDRGMIQEIQRAHRDELGSLFGGKYYLANHLFWEIEVDGHHVEVTRYYPGKGIALDIFQSIEADEQELIDKKRRALLRLGVRYAALSWEGHPTDILPQIGLT